jgi:hypothetical protein
MKNKTERINTRSRQAINRLTGAKLYFLDSYRLRKLWEIRGKDLDTRPLDDKEMAVSHALLDENRADFKEISDKYLWF